MIVLANGLQIARYTVASIALEVRLPSPKTHGPGPFEAADDLRHWRKTSQSLVQIPPGCVLNRPHNSFMAIGCCDIEFWVFGKIPTLTRLLQCVNV